MSTEPITIFSKEPNVLGVAKLLRSLNLGVQIDGPDENWTKASIKTGGFFTKRKLIISHASDYYLEPNRSVQLQGMQGYFSSFPDCPSKEALLQLIPSFRFALGTMHDPDFSDGDDRLIIISQVATMLDAVLFLPSSMRDANGRILLGADGYNDPQAVWPR